MPIVNTPEDQDIIRYLLGNLEEREIEEIEQRYFCDSSFEEHVGAVEDLLIRGFLEGALPVQDVALFESKYLKVPELREKVAFARRLRNAALSEIGERDPRSGSKRWPRWATAMLPPAFATVGLLCFVASWVIVHNEHRADEVRLMPPTNKATQSAPVGLEQVPGPRVLSAVLLPGLSKGAENKPFRLLLPHDIKEVRLEFDVPGEREELMARVEILLVQNNGRKLVWSQDRVPSVSTPVGRTVLVALKPENLASGDYIAYVEDSSRGSGGEPLQSYVFGIVRP